MKICITSQGADWQAKVDERFGRAPYFLIVNTDTSEYRAIRNAGESAGHGAGIAAAQEVSNAGVAAVLTGSLGPKAVSALKAAGIKMYEGLNGAETVQEAVEKFRQGAYREMAC